MGKNWTQEEHEYLEEWWGSKPVRSIAANLGRSESAVINKVHRMGLGPFLMGAEYVSVNQLVITLGIHDRTRIYGWIESAGFPAQKRRVRRSLVRVTKIEQFWRWAGEHRDLINWAKLQRGALGKEPAWVEECRKRDRQRAERVKTSPWTESEDSMLLSLVKSGRYNWKELSDRLCRTNGAVQRRLKDLNVPDRPLRASPHDKPWSEQEKTALLECIRAGENYTEMPEKFGRSEKAIRGMVDRLYGTESLPKARQRMKEAV